MARYWYDLHITGKDIGTGKVSGLPRISELSNGTNGNIFSLPGFRAQVPFIKLQEQTINPLKWGLNADSSTLRTMRWQRQQQTVRLWQFTLSTWWDWKHLCVSVRVFPQMPNSGWEGVPWMWAALSQRLAQTMEQNGNKNKPTRRGTICFLAAIKQARLLLLTVH